LSTGASGAEYKFVITFLPWNGYGSAWVLS
jgi:hypothetical protein